MKPAPTPRRRQPGERLRGLAARLCSINTLDRIVDPLIADIQHEDRVAFDGGSRVRRVWVRLRGYSAFWRTMALHSAAVAWQRIVSPSPATPVLDVHLFRVLGGRTLAGLVGLSALMVLARLGPLFVSTLFVLQHQRYPEPEPLAHVWPALVVVLQPKSLVYLLPNMAAMMMPLSVWLGTILTLRASPPRLRTRAELARTVRGVTAFAIGITLATFVMAAWIVPETNQRFRQAVFASITGSRMVEGVPAKGTYELTLPELKASAQRMEAAGTDGPVALLRLEFHGRFARAVACLAFALLALAAAIQGLSGRAVIAWSIVLVLAFHGVLRFAGRAVELGWLPPFAGAWLADAIVAMVALTLLRRQFTGIGPGSRIAAVP